jgi:hypothetical protein
MKGLNEAKIWRLPVAFFLAMGISTTMFVSHYAPKMWNIDGGSQPLLIMSAQRLAAAV